MRTSSSQAEGAKRDFAVNTKRFEGKDGRVTKLICVKVDEKFKEIPGTEFEIPADMVLLAMGFVAPEAEAIAKGVNVALDGRGNVKATDRDYATSRPKVWAAGDIRRGQSLVVWAIREGRQAAHSIDKALMGKTDLPR
jgi:glutamate synthase (NADPH) small chain